MYQWKENEQKQLDEEWVELIHEALEAGLSHDMIREYFEIKSNPFIRANKYTTS